MILKPELYGSEILVFDGGDKLGDGNVTNEAVAFSEGCFNLGRKLFILFPSVEGCLADAGVINCNLDHRIFFKNFKKLLPVFLYTGVNRLLLFCFNGFLRP